MAGGVVTLVRHGEPALSRDIKLTAGEYRAWWARYELGGLKPGQTPPPPLLDIAAAAGTVLASTRLRSVQSAQALVGDRPFERDEVLIESPLPPPAFPAWLRLSPRQWGFIARVWWWYFNIHDAGEESRAIAEARAEDAARRLIALTSEGQDVLVVAHGFFNTLIGRALKRLGWRCVKYEGWRYWSTKVYQPPGRP